MLSALQPSYKYKILHPHYHLCSKMCSILFSSFVIFLLFILSINPCFAAGAHSHQLNRDAFPEGFVFGTAASAYQVEGMALKGGRGPCIWDAFVRVPGIMQSFSFSFTSSSSLKWFNIFAWRISIRVCWLIAGMIPNNATADVSVDEYHHYKVE